MKRHSGTTTSRFYQGEKLRSLRPTHHRHRLSLPEFGGVHRMLMQPSCAPPLDRLMSDTDDIRLTSYLSLGIQKLVADLQVLSPQTIHICSDDMPVHSGLQYSPVQNVLNTEIAIIEPNRCQLAPIPLNLYSDMKLSPAETANEIRKDTRRSLGVIPIGNRDSIINSLSGTLNDINGGLLNVTCGNEKIFDTSSHTSSTLTCSLHMSRSSRSSLREHGAKLVRSIKKRFSFPGTSSKKSSLEDEIVSFTRHNLITAPPETSTARSKTESDSITCTTSSEKNEKVPQAISHIKSCLKSSKACRVVAAVQDSIQWYPPSQGPCIKANIRISTNNVGSLSASDIHEESDCLICLVDGLSQVSSYTLKVLFVLEVLEFC